MTTKRLFLFYVFLFLLRGFSSAQDFITRGKIEFEVKRNQKQFYADLGMGGIQEEGFSIVRPEFDFKYRELIFSESKSIYQTIRKNDAPFMLLNENSVFIDLDKEQCIRKEKQVDQYYVYADSLKKIKWKIENETRKIIGFRCRKAIGVIKDSVYVVAFYCPEIIPQGGPELFTGLPGMILGLAIPRYHTTWFAIKLEVADINESVIVPPVIKKSRQYTKKELVDLLYKKYTEAGWLKNTNAESFERDFYNYVL